MRAVIVDEITVLPRVPVPEPVMARQRPVTGITTAPRGPRGVRVPARHAFAGVDLPQRLACWRRRWFRRCHPVDDGRVPILHIETPPEEMVASIAGGRAEFRGSDPTYMPIRHGLRHRQRGRACRNLPWQPEFDAHVPVLAGRGTVGAGGRPVSIGQRAVLGQGDALTFVADPSQDGRTETTEVLLLEGRPSREPIAWDGRAVTNTEAEVHQAFEDFQAGRRGQVLASPTPPRPDRGPRVSDSPLDGSHLHRRAAQDSPRCAARASAACGFWACPSVLRYAGASPRSALLISISMRSCGKHSSPRTASPSWNGSG
jgi:hypothetical protein